MALTIHQFLGSCATLPSRPLPWNVEMELKQLVAKVHAVAKTDRSLSFQCNNSCLRVGEPLVRGPKGTFLKISAYKGNAQNNEPERKSVNNSIELSRVSCVSEETLTGSPAIQTGRLSYGSLALFKNWITLLRTESPSQMVVESSERPAREEASEMPIRSPVKEKGAILKAVWCYFLDLNATVKIPLLIFIPWYFAVNMIYGSSISKELTPLWVFGPLIVALYVKMFRGLRALYTYTVHQTVKVIKNLPMHYQAAHSYIARGEIQESVQVHFLRPLMDVTKLDFRELSNRKRRNLEVYMVEKYLDFVESIWPYYCRTIRFLKRANFI